jgi:hypothetical protein
MRYLGADPSRPADKIERHLMILLHNRVIAEEKTLRDG